MNVITVGIGGLEVTADPGSVLITHGLGSCIAVIVYDPKRKIGGMLHFQLPTASLSPERAAASPGTFADSGIPLLFERLYALGCQKRNITIMRKIFWKAQVLVSAEDLGGSRSRTVRLFVDTGQVTVQSGSAVAPL